MEELLSNEIYISGLPFTFHGWNHRLIKEKDRERYILPSYYLYGLIPVKQLELQKDLISRKWVLRVSDIYSEQIGEKEFRLSDDEKGSFFCSNNDPCGHYRNDKLNIKFKITPYKNTWM